jgi:hypothetical protein
MDLHSKIEKPFFCLFYTSSGLCCQELGAYLRPAVSNASGQEQTPLYGRLEGKGEFLFFVPGTTIPKIDIVNDYSELFWVFDPLRFEFSIRRHLALSAPRIRNPTEKWIDSLWTGEYK